MFTKSYFESISELPGRDIAGMAMFDALIEALRAAEESTDLPARIKKTVLRQIAKQAAAVADRHKLDHSISLEDYVTG